MIYSSVPSRCAARQELWKLGIRKLLNKSLLAFFLKKKKKKKQPTQYHDLPSSVVNTLPTDSLHLGFFCKKKTIMFVIMQKSKLPEIEIVSPSEREQKIMVDL